MKKILLVLPILMLCGSNYLWYNYHIIKLTEQSVYINNLEKELERCLSHTVVELQYNLYENEIEELDIELYKCKNGSTN